MPKMHLREDGNDSKIFTKLVKKGKATLFIHGLCLKLEACGAVYMKQILNKHNISNKVDKNNS